MGNRIEEPVMADMLAGRVAPVHGRFEAFVDAKGNALQLPNFMATVAGIKPAMDDWVQTDRVEQFTEMARSFGLHVWEDVYFDPIERDEELRGIIGGQLLNTTKAKGFNLPPSSSAASLHVFLSKNVDHAREAYNSGWYPLIIGDRVMDVPLSDHIASGRAFGYPECCIEYFRKNDDWESQNIYYAAYVQSNRSFSALCNCLPKSTAFFYSYHLPCSFSCEATVRYASELRSFIVSEDSSYAGLIDYVIKQPVLVIAENCAYLIIGEIQSEHECKYTGAFFIGSEPAVDRYSGRLQRGNRFRVVENMILVYRGRTLVDIIETRADKFAPEIPFLLLWNT